MLKDTYKSGTLKQRPLELVNIQYSFLSICQYKGEWQDSNGRQVAERQHLILFTESRSVGFLITFGLLIRLHRNVCVQLQRELRDMNWTLIMYTLLLCFMDYYYYVHIKATQISNNLIKQVVQVRLKTNMG